MNRKPRTFYRYRAFDLKTLSSLCEDKLFFSSPSAFNDPLDSRPTLVADSQLHELRNLLNSLVQRRVAAEIQKSVKSMRMSQQRAEFYVSKNAELEARKALEYVAYHATNPDYEEGPVEAERSLLTAEIERELLLHYEKGVCCFSAEFRNPLLWSHYGGQHHGICIGYTTNRLPAPSLQRVVYGGRRVIQTSLVASAFLAADEKSKEALDRDILLRKAKDWRYECEWRLVGGSGEQDSPLLMTEVIFGLRCSDVVRHCIVEALDRRRPEVKFFEMRESPSRYTLRRESLDADELASYLPRVAMSGHEMFPPEVSELPS